MVLQVLYWIIIILCLAAHWFPEPYFRLSRFIEVVLFVIIGLKLFGFPT